jgi:hypothetical protein
MIITDIPELSKLTYTVVDKLKMLNIFDTTGSEHFFYHETFYTSVDFNEKYLYNLNNTVITRCIDILLTSINKKIRDRYTKITLFGWPSIWFEQIGDRIKINLNLVISF